jgi:hypothetical protein
MQSNGGGRRGGTYYSPLLTTHHYSLRTAYVLREVAHSVPVPSTKVLHTSLMPLKLASLALIVLPPLLLRFESALPSAPGPNPVSEASSSAAFDPAQPMMNKAACGLLKTLFVKRLAMLTGDKTPASRLSVR